MPELSPFLGIVIYMLYDDHRPAIFMPTTASIVSR